MVESVNIALTDFGLESVLEDFEGMEFDTEIESYEKYKELHGELLAPCLLFRMKKISTAIRKSLGSFGTRERSGSH